MAAQRVVRSAAGVSRAEALRIWPDQRTPVHRPRLSPLGGHIGPRHLRGRRSREASGAQRAPQRRPPDRGHATGVRERGRARRGVRPARAGRGGRRRRRGSRQPLQTRREDGPSARRALLYNKPSKAPGRAPRVLFFSWTTPCTFRGSRRRTSAARRRRSRSADPRGAAGAGPRDPPRCSSSGWSTASRASPRRTRAFIRTPRPRRPGSCRDGTAGRAQVGRFGSARRRFALFATEERRVFGRPSVFREMLSTPAYAPLSDPRASARYRGPCERARTRSRRW